MTLESTDELVKCIETSTVVSSEKLANAVKRSGSRSAKDLAVYLIKSGLLSSWQAKFLLTGRHNLRLDNYILTNRIARDELGDRFEARHESLDRSVILQLLPKSVSDDSELREFFVSHVGKIADIDHPNLVDVHNVDEHSGRFYVVNEFLNGVSIVESVLDSRMLVLCTNQALSGVAFAQSHGILHGQLNEERIWVLNNGNFKIVGAGLAALQRKLKGGEPPQPADDFIALAKILKSRFSILPAEDQFELSWLALLLDDLEANPLGTYEVAIQKTNEVIATWSVASMPVQESPASLASPALQPWESEGSSSSASESSVGRHQAAKSSSVNLPSSLYSTLWYKHPFAVSSIALGALVLLIGGMWIGGAFRPPGQSTKDQVAKTEVDSKGTSKSSDESRSAGGGTKKFDPESGNVHEALRRAKGDTTETKKEAPVPRMQVSKVNVEPAPVPVTTTSAEVIAIWDNWNDDKGSLDADNTVAGFSASLSGNAIRDIQSLEGAVDGTFGSLTSPAASATNRRFRMKRTGVFGTDAAAHLARSRTLTATVTNNSGADSQLSGVFFDLLATNGSFNSWTVEQDGVVLGIGESIKEDTWTDADVVFETPVAIANGETVELDVIFSGATHGNSSTRLDNFAITAGTVATSGGSDSVPEPVSVPKPVPELASLPQTNPEPEPKAEPSPERVELFGSFAERIELPNSKSKEPFLIGSLAETTESLDLQIISSSLCFKGGRGAFALQKVDGESWNVLLKKSSKTDEGNIVGQFKLAGQDLSFTWGPKVGAKSKANFIRNCLLIVTADQQQKTIGLRQPASIPVFSLTEGNYKQRVTAPVDFPPSTDAIKIEISKPASWPETFLETGPMGALHLFDEELSELTMYFDSDLPDQNLAVIVKPTVKSKLQFLMTVNARGKETAAVELNSYADAEELCAELQRAKGVAFGQHQQAVVIKANAPEGTRRNANALAKSAAQNLELVNENLTIATELRDFLSNSLHGGEFPVTVYYELDGQRVIIARTAAAAN